MPLECAICAIQLLVAVIHRFGIGPIHLEATLAIDVDRIGREDRHFLAYRVRDRHRLIPEAAAGQYGGGSQYEQRPHEVNAPPRAAAARTAGFRRSGSSAAPPVYRSGR